MTNERSRSRGSAGFGAADGSGSSLSRYLEEVSRIPLLTREQEREVGGELTDSRENLLREYARIPEAVEEICRWARRAATGEVCFDRYFDFADGPRERGERVRGDFIRIVDGIESDLELLRAMHERAESRPGSAGGKRRGKERSIASVEEAIAAGVLGLHSTEPIIAKAEERVLEMLDGRRVPLSVVKEVSGSYSAVKGVAQFLRAHGSTSGGNGNGNGNGNGSGDGKGNGNGHGRSLAGTKRASGDGWARTGRDRRLEEAIGRIRAARRRFEDCRRILTESNMRLAIAVAKHYRNRGLPLSDLVQEGNLGLIRACDRFDSRKGYRFSTYAVYWIRQSISRALPEQSRTVRVPPHLTDLLSRVLDGRTRLRGALGREPDEGELAKFLGISADKLGRVRSLPLEVLSLDRPIGDERNAPHWDLPDPRSPSPLLDAQRTELRRAAARLGEVLSAREVEVLGLRFGLSGRREMTLEEIGRRFSVTRERVRQIQAEALRKLRGSEFAGLGGHARRDGPPETGDQL